MNPHGSLPKVVVCKGHEGHRKGVLLPRHLSLDHLEWILALITRIPTILSHRETLFHRDPPDIVIFCTLHIGGLNLGISCVCVVSVLDPW